jgi:hypothetical protein
LFTATSLTIDEEELQAQFILLCRYAIPSIPVRVPDHAFPPTPETEYS